MIYLKKEVWWLAKGLAYLVQLNDVGVANFFEDFDFPGDAFNVFLVVYLFLLKNFDCHLLIIHNA